MLTSIALILLKKVSVDTKGELVGILSDVRFYGATVVYGIAFLMWVVSASKIDYTILIFSNTLSLVIGGLVGYFVFGESITTEKLFAYTLILSGVLMLFYSLVHIRGSN